MDTSSTWEPMHFELVPIDRETGFVLSDLKKVEENIEEAEIQKSLVNADVAK